MSAPPQVQARVDQDVTDAARTIRRYGQSIQFVLGRWREPTFAYTIGIFGLGHPELLVFGLDSDTAAAVQPDLRAGPLRVRPRPR